MFILHLGALLFLPIRSPLQLPVWFARFTTTGLFSSCFSHPVFFPCFGCDGASFLVGVLGGSRYITAQFEFTANSQDWCSQVA